MRRATFLGCIAFALLVACRGPERGRDAAGPQRHESVVFGTLADAATLDPAESADNHSDGVVFSVYETLLTFDSDMHIVGGLAERWERAPDETTWTFHLRRGVRFHDGTTLDAAAVKQSLDRLRDPAAAHRNRSILEAVAEIRVLDPSTLQIVTAFPFGALDASLAHVATGIVSPAAAARWGKSYGRSADAASGSGPFRVDRWIRDRELVLARNDEYWGEKPPLKRVIYRPVPDTQARVAALEIGDVDVIKTFQQTAMQRLKANPDIRIENVPSINSIQLRFNCGRPPFNDQRLRRAMSFAIDRREIVEHLFQDMAEVPKGPLHPVIRNAVPLPEIPYDPAQARRLLKEAGHPDGFKAILSTTNSYVGGVEVAEVMAEQLKRVGIEVTIDIVDFGTFAARTAVTPEQDPRQMYITGIGASTADADWALRPRYASFSPINIGFYKNVEFDRVVVQAMREVDPTKRLALYKRAEEIVYFEDPPVLWLYHNHAVIAARRQLRDLIVMPLNLISFAKASVAQQ